MGLIFALSSVPGRRIQAAHDWDKVAHVLEYAVLGWLGQRALREVGLSPGRAALVSAAGAILYGASDEWHQSFVPGRSSDPADVAADAAGAVLGAGVALLAETRGLRSAARDRGVPGG